ncbi:hypothetical protein T439DRAFT_328681 [Meredithblackwellia eburnea MCA 4105]
MNSTEEQQGQEAHQEGTTTSSLAEVAAVVESPTTATAPHLPAQSSATDDDGGQQPPSSEALPPKEQEKSTVESSQKPTQPPPTLATRPSVTHIHQRASYHHRSPSSSALPSPKPSSLTETARDLRTLLHIFRTIIPSSFRRLRYLIPSPLIRLARHLTNQLAMSLHKRGALASSLFYDLLVFWWKSVIGLFFREIRSRGAWKVPREGEGAVIFVVGPHHNQFLDPLLLMSEVRRESGRRISFLTAAKSMERKFIGQAAKLMQSIPVARPQDLAFAGPGTLHLSPDDPLTILGQKTTFTKDLKPKSQLMLGKQFGNSTVEVVEVVSDTEVRVKKEFKEKAVEGIREKGEKGVTYKILPYVDQSSMYSSVYQKLKEGGCIGIFPEGGSHDRTDLLPLKAGVSIMALGALSSNPSLRLRLVPVGLSYFHPHRFRSRAVVEFGTPIEVPRECVEDFEKGGERKREAIGKMMDMVVGGLKAVTVRTPDYETLMLIQATRRLYRPPGQHLTLGQIVELNKRFIAGYEVYKDEPRLLELRKRVEEYNTLLRYMGLKDHQIERVARPLWRSIILLAYRIGLLSVWGTLALPGVILNAPIFLAAGWISRIKAREALAASTVKIKGNDVLATWKVLVALAGAPTLYTVYAIGATVLAFKLDLPRKYKIWAPVATYAGLPLIGYSALKFGEVGMDVYKSLRPLLLSVLPGNVKQLDKLRTMRTSLQHDISLIVNEFGPQLFEDFQATRIIPPTALPPPPTSPTLVRRRSTYGPQGQNTFLTHPMSWVDEYLFGWNEQQQASGKNSVGPGTLRGADSDAGATSDDGGLHSGYVSGYTTDEPGDYDEVIHILSREQGDETDSQVGPGTLRRRGSRSRSRSQLDLTALDHSGNRSGPPSRTASRVNLTALSTSVEDKGASKRTAAGKDDVEE